LRRDRAPGSGARTRPPRRGRGPACELKQGCRVQRPGLPIGSGRLQVVALFGWLTWRFVRRGALVVVALLVGYFLVTFEQVWSTGRGDDRRASQAIIVLGAAQYDGRPSAVFRARLDHAVALYRDGIAPTIVVTGGKQPGDRFTEA